MGMSASQGRMLTLTARMSDLEFSAQSISNSKIRLASQSEEIAKDYADALDKKHLMYAKGYNANTGATQYAEATIAMLINYNPESLEAQRILKDSNGNVIVPAAVGNAYENSTTLASFLAAVPMKAEGRNDAAEISYYTRLYNECEKTHTVGKADDSTVNSSDYLYNELQNGNLYLEKWNARGGDDGAGKFEGESWATDPTLSEQTDNTDINKAQAKYDSAMAKINTQDKRFDLELKNIDTEHSAIQTEIDSVKKVIDKNIERSFKVFQG